MWLIVMISINLDKWVIVNKLKMGYLVQSLM